MLWVLLKHNVFCQKNANYADLTKNLQKRYDYVTQKKSKKIHSFCFQAGYKIITYLPMDIEIVPPFFTSVQSRVIQKCCMMAVAQYPWIDT